MHQVYKFSIDGRGRAAKLILKKTKNRLSNSLAEETHMAKKRKAAKKATKKKATKKKAKKK